MTYTTSNGIITSPGKFEGQPEYTLHFWELALQGEYDDIELLDDTDREFFVFRITQDDISNYPGHFDLGDRLLLWEDDQGFVCHLIRPA